MSPYDIPGRPGYDRNIWECHPAGYWVLKGSDNKGYNCTEYVMARIEGRPPRWGDDDTQTTEEEEIEQALRDLGFDDSAFGSCGAGEGEMSQCVVLYFNVIDGERADFPFHVEMYDPVRGDWGGKGNAGLPIRHRRDPNEFPVDPAERAQTVRMFLCRTAPEGWRPIPDADLHESATRTERTEPVEHGPLPPPYSPGPFIRAWNWLRWLGGGIIIGWLLHMWIS